MPTIFDLVTANHIAAYWLEVGNADTHFTESLFPTQKQLGLNLEWIKGSKGRPVVLNPSAFDAASIPRARIGFTELKAQMPYFKESLYVDEELRQQLNLMIATGKQPLIDSVLDRVFDDQLRLLRAAAARREQMRCMLLTTGAIAMVGNGQEHLFDYGLKHKENVAVAWSDTATANPIEDIRLAKETIQEETGEVITRAMCDGLSFRNLVNNAKIRASIFAFTPGTGGIVSERLLNQFLLDEVGITVLVNDNRYVESNGTTVRYVPENTFSMFPDGNLGNTWFGTTPAESDLMNSNIANVATVDTGVAVTTATKTDPVQVETIVSQICLPSLERADSIYILDTNPA